MNKDRTKEDWITRGRDVIARKYRFPTLTITKSDPLYLIDIEGKKYLDFTSGGQTANLGHKPQKVLGAVQHQLEMTGLSSLGWLPNDTRVRLAEKLMSIAPRCLRGGKVGFCNTGSEATELSFRLAKQYTGRDIVLCSFGCFHGQTSQAALSLNTSPHGRKYGLPLVSGVFYVPFPYCYRCLFGAEYPDCELACLDFVRYQFDTNVIPPEQVAAFFLEPIQVHGGVIALPPLYAEEVSRLCKEYGIILAVDEVTTGFGRTGHMFSIEKWGCEIDLLYMAKPMAAGLNMGAIISNEEIMDYFRGGGTFSGNPVAAAASLANIETIEEEKLLENCRSVGGYFKSELHERFGDHERVGDIRGEGLLLGIELVTDRASKKPDCDLTQHVIRRSMQEGLLIFPAGVFQNVIRICPPLNISRKEVDTAVEILQGVIEEGSN